MAVGNYTLTNQDIIKGGHLMIFVEGNPIAFATSHSLNKTLNTQEISTKDHGDYAAVLPQNISWEITTENLYSLNDYKTLTNTFNQKKEVTVYFGESSYSQSSTQESIVGVQGANWTLGTFYEYGKAYITSLQVTAGAGENATFSATFTGNGGITPIDTGATGGFGPTGTYNFPNNNPTGVQGA